MYKRQDVITGTIKANFPSRLSYKVASKFDSRTILNEMGAEQLLGSGDMLFLENGANLKRLHGGFLSEGEIEKVVKSIKEQAIFDQKNEITLEEKNDNGSMGFGFDDGEVDALYTKAVNIVIEQQKVWTPPSYLYTPNAPNGYRHRWVRIEILGFVDTKNIQGRLRSGYELVRADEYPEEDFPVVADGKYAGVIGHGGLVLTRVPEEIAQQRTEYYMKQAQDQQAAIDADLAKEQHKSMPITVDRDTRVTFGGSKKS